MNWWNNLLSTLQRGWATILNFGSGGIAGPISGALHGLQQTANGLLYVMTHPLSDLTNAIAVTSGLISGNDLAVYQAMQRFFGFTQAHQTNPLLTYVNKQFKALWAALSALRAWTFKLVWLAVATARLYTDQQIAAERRARIAGDQQDRAYTRQQIKALHSLIEREAASGYDTGYDARISVITRLLDDAAVRVPVVRELAARVVSIALDLVAVDNPAARLLAGFLLTHIINRLGIDKALGSLTSDLLTPLLGNARPRDLHDVMRSVSDRLGAVEGQWATFMHDGGPQILQAGEVWRGITSLGADAALLAFTAAAIADPQGTARDVAAVIRPIGTGIISDMAHFLARG